MTNTLMLFITLHLLGDYYFQFRRLANYKEKSLWGVLLHSVLYSIPALLSILFVDANNYLIWIAILCAVHFTIDIIKSCVKPFYFTPKDNNDKAPSRQHLLKVDVRYFADQFLHLITIFILSVWFLHHNSDIHLKQWLINSFIIDTAVLSKLLAALAAFIAVLQPVNITFYKIFDIELLATARAPKSGDDTSESTVDIKGTGAIIGFMERIIIMCLLILGAYTAIGFVIAGKSIIRLNSSVKQEFYIIGTFYGIITSIIPFVLFFKL